MEQKRQQYISIGIDIGADFSLMAAALPTQEIIGRPYKILHSSYRSVQGAVDRILALRQTYELPARVYMESTGVYHLPLYHRFRDAGLEVFVLNPIVTHANQNMNIRNVHNDKYDAQRIALLGLRPGLKTSVIPDDEIAAVKALLREYHAMKKETSMYICRLKNQLRQVLPQQRRLPQPVRPLLRRTASGGPGKAGIDVLTGASSFEKLAAAVLEQARKGDSSAVPVDTSH